MITPVVDRQKKKQTADIPPSEPIPADWSARDEAIFLEGVRAGRQENASLISADAWIDVLRFLQSKEVEIIGAASRLEKRLAAMRKDQPSPEFFDAACETVRFSHEDQLKLLGEIGRYASDQSHQFMSDISPKGT